jgi:hypothetical protein
MKQVPSLDPMDPTYRRLRYIRYADDWLLGFSGPRCEAEAIKREVGAFLRDELKLELSETKTLITHAQSQAARFLGYNIQVLHNDQKRDRRGHRCLNGQIGLRVPPAVVRDKCKRYLRHGEPIHRTELIHDSVFSIVAQFQREYRGVVEYYRRAYNLHQFDRLKWTMEQSLTRTLARKLRMSVARVYRCFGATLQTDQGPRVGLEVRAERDAGMRPLIAQWGGITLARHKKAVLEDSIPLRICSLRSDLERRLLANTCELCGSQEDIEVHHVRALKDLQYKGRRPPPLWIQVMAARQRKTLVTCQACHADIHAGRPLRCTLPTILEDTGEPGAPKGARPVRGGAVGKVPAMATR